LRQTRGLIPPLPVRANTEQQVGKCEIISDSQISFCA